MVQDHTAGVAASHRLGQGIQRRLQGYMPEPQGSPANRFSLALWQQTCTLEAFGVELCVFQGAVRVSLRHVAADGQHHPYGMLDCAAPGSAFSPPIFTADLDGYLEPVIEEASPDAVFDLYFGTNDIPPQAQAKLGLILRCTSAQTAEVAERFRAFLQSYAAQAPRQGLVLILVTEAPVPELSQDANLQILVHPLSQGHAGIQADNWGVQALTEVAYGPLVAQGFSHLCLKEIRDPAAELSPEIFARLLALVRFQPVPDAASPPPVLYQGTDAPQSTTGWPWVCLDICTLHQQGPLSGRNWPEVASQLQADHVPLVALPHLWPPSLPAAQETEPSPADPAGAATPHDTLWQRIGRMIGRMPPLKIGSDTGKIAPQSPSEAGLRALHLKLDSQHRREQARLNRRITELEQRLQHSHLLDPARTLADQSRASRTLLSLLRQRHRGQRAVIIGNGPSLTIADLDRLAQTGSDQATHQDTVTFASNKIYLAYDQTDWRPTYYSVEDHLVMRNNREKIDALSGSIKIFPDNLRDFGYHTGDTIFAPFLPPASFEDPLSDPDFPAFSRDLSHGIAWGSSIVYSQIQMALYMGCQEIILIGVDHSYQLPDTKRGNQYIHDGEQNHFHPRYRDPGEAWHQPNLEVLEVSYAKAGHVCAAAGVRLLNASRRSALDKLERADFDQLFPPVPQSEPPHDRPDL